MVIIEVKGISKRYKKTAAVKSCDLQVASGNILALLGPRVQERPPCLG